MEDGLQWNTIFDGGQPSMQDNLCREKTELLNWRLPKLEFDNKDQTLLALSLSPTFGIHLFYRIKDERHVPQF